MADKAYEVLYITRKHPPSVGGMQRLSFELRQSLTKVLRLHAITWGYSQKWLPLFIIYAYYRAIFYLITQPQIRIILAGDPVLAPLALSLKLIFKRKTLVIIHGLDITYSNKFYQRFIVGCLRKLDAFICISRNTEREAVERGLPKQKCFFVPVGIDPARFTTTVSSLNSPVMTLVNKFKGTDSVILLTVGRLVKRKGVVWFVQHVLPILLNEHPQLVYFIVGNGPQKKDVEILIQQLKLTDSIFLLTDIKEENLQAVYQAADIFVMPNIHVKGDLEGFGIVALEAAARGNFVVASKIEGIEDAITDQKNGLLIPSKNVERYIEILTLVIEDTEFRTRFAQQAKNFTLENFNWTNIANSYIEIIRDLDETNVIT